MYKIGEYIVFQKEVCQIMAINENTYNHLQCYNLETVRDRSLKLSIPVTNNNIRKLLTKDELENLIKEIPDIAIIQGEDKQIENEYKRLLNTGEIKDLIQIIKTTYLRNQKRLENKKKISEKDNRYFELAESYLYTEISIILDTSFEKAKDYIVTKVAEQEKFE